MCFLVVKCVISIFCEFFFFVWLCFVLFFFFSSRRRHTRCLSDWSSDVCSSDLVTDGGVFSYGASLPERVRQLGRYAGRVLRGTKPADLPIDQPTRFEFVINARRSEERRVGKECRSRWVTEQ